MLTRASSLFGPAPTNPLHVAEWTRVRAYVAWANGREDEARDTMEEAASRFGALGENEHAAELRRWIEEVAGGS